MFHPILISLFSLHYVRLRKRKVMREDDGHGEPRRAGCFSFTTGENQVADFTEPRAAFLRRETPMRSTFAARREREREKEVTAIEGGTAARLAMRALNSGNCRERRKSKFGIARDKDLPVVPIDVRSYRDRFVIISLARLPEIAVASVRLLFVPQSPTEMCRVAVDKTRHYFRRRDMASPLDV